MSSVASPRFSPKAKAGVHARASLLLKGLPSMNPILTQRHAPADVDAVLAEIRRWERAARIVADDPSLSMRQTCKALLEMMAKARRSELAAFLERATWKGCAHLFEEESPIPTDTIGAIRSLLRRGLDACPECRRPLPDHSTLDYWRELTHDYRRPA
jgi:hypothetical protein